LAKRATSSEIGTGSAAPERPARERILGAAFRAFTERGYAETSTLEIATRARVSKRELYAIFGNKQAILVACISSHTDQLRLPLALPAPRDRAMLASILTRFGSGLMQGISDPKAMAMIRLAVAEAERSPEVAQVLDAASRQANRAALSELFAKAQAAGFLASGDTLDMASQFLALLWRDLLLSMLLRIADRPTPKEIERRAAAATEAFLRLHP
jgi:AcrR family transcriptional regulator